MIEKKEYRYSVTSKVNRGTSRKEKRNLEARFENREIGDHVSIDGFLTVRFDDLEEIPRIRDHDRLLLGTLLSDLEATIDECVTMHLIRPGVSIEAMLATGEIPDPEPEKPEEPRGMIHTWQKNPYPTVKALLKATALSKAEFADLKRLEESHGGTVNSGRIDPDVIPVEVLVDWLRGYYVRREEQAHEAKDCETGGGD